MLSPVTVIVFHHIIPEQRYSPSVLIHLHKQIKAACQLKYAPLLSNPASVRINKYSPKGGQGQATHQSCCSLFPKCGWCIWDPVKSMLGSLALRHTKDRALMHRTERTRWNCNNFIHSLKANNIFSVHKSQVVFVFRDLPKPSISSLFKSVLEHKQHWKFPVLHDFFIYLKST